MRPATTADTSYQGWIEANLIFVAPDEVGRVQTLSVQEGDTVKTGEPLFTVDDDLQQADLAQVKASLTNAQQTFDRASQLAKTGAGTQKDLDQATAVLRDAQARLNSSQTRLTRRKVFSPVDGTVQQIYYRPGEMVPAGRPVLALLPPGNIKVRFYVPETALPSVAYGDTIKIGCDGCANGSHRAGEFHRQAIRVHAAGDLQPRRALQARVPGRGAAGKAGRVARRPAGRRVGRSAGIDRASCQILSAHA